MFRYFRSHVFKFVTRCSSTTSIEVDVHCAQNALKLPNLKPPRKPLTPYFLFMKERRPELHKLHPDKKTDEILREIAGMWNSLPNSQKKTYQERYEREISEYKKMEENWWSTLPISEKEHFWDYKKNVKLHLSLKRLSRKLRALEKPKRPPVPHLLFITAEQSKRKAEPRNKSFKNALVTWKNLQEEDKKMGYGMRMIRQQYCNALAYMYIVYPHTFTLRDSRIHRSPFIELSRWNHKHYVTRMLVWEFKMMKEGNGHLLQQVKHLQKKLKIIRHQKMFY